MNDIPEKIYINPESFRTPSGEWQGRVFPSEVEYVPASRIAELEAENMVLKNNVAWYKRQSEMWYKYYEKLQKIREMLDD